MLLTSSLGYGQNQPLAAGRAQISSLPLLVAAEDWDDTLCPTSWVFEQIRKCPDNKALAAVEKHLVQTSFCRAFSVPVPGRAN